MDIIQQSGVNISWLLVHLLGIRIFYDLVKFGNYCQHSNKRHHVQNTIYKRLRSPGGSQEDSFVRRVHVTVATWRSWSSKQRRSIFNKSNKIRNKYYYTFLEAAVRVGGRWPLGAAIPDHVEEAEVPSLKRRSTQQWARRRSPPVPETSTGRCSQIPTQLLPDRDKTPISELYSMDMLLVAAR